jgi:PmbA protein
MARDGEETQTGFEFAVASSAADLDIPAIARAAAAKALEKLGAREIESGEYSAVFTADAASELLSAFIASPASPFYGENIQKGRSLLAGRVGQTIGSPLFTLIDEPHSGLAPVFFDGDGIDTTPCTVVDRGVFTTVLHNMYSAAREKDSKSTGHASRGKSNVGTSFHNPKLTPGEGRLDNLIESAGQAGKPAILVSEMEGLHAGLNPVTGDFSLSAKGFRITDGSRGEALRNMVVSGNFYDLIMNLSAKAADARDVSMHALSSPSILVTGLSVSGK